MTTIWRLDFGMHYGEIINKICNQEQLDMLKFKYNNVNYMKYYYGQVEVSTKYGNCDDIADDLYKMYKCPIKISIDPLQSKACFGLEDEYGIDKIDSISYNPSLRKYQSDPSDSDSDSESEYDEYTSVDKVYNNWKLTRPDLLLEKDSEKVKKIIKILDGECYANNGHSDGDSYDDNDVKYDSVDEAYNNWIRTRPGVDFESEEEIRIIKILDGYEKCYCTFCDWN